VARFRLDLGFGVRNVIAWQYCREPYIILADPRVRGSLSFCVHDEARLAAHRRKRKSRSWDSLFEQPPLMAHFCLLDSWRHDLVGKFQTRLQKAIATLEPPRG
jgi:hypothetical protein